MGQICLANMVTGFAQLENTEISENIAPKYQYIAIYRPQIPIPYDISTNLDPFTVPIKVRVLKIGLSLNGYGHGVDVGVGACHYKVTE